MEGEVVGTGSHSGGEGPWRFLFGKKGLWLALGAALLARLCWVILVPNQPVSDSSIYHSCALNIAGGNGFCFENGDPNGFWAVGYSALLGFFYSIFGGRLLTGYLMNTLLGLFLVGLVHLLGKRFYGRKTGLAAAWITALYPGLVMYVTIPASENLFLPVLAGSVYLLTGTFLPPEKGGAGELEGRRLLAAALGGVALGAAALVRPVALAFPLLVFLGGILYKAGFFRSLALAVLSGAFMVGVCLPWGMRNKRVFGEFTLVAFNGGPVLWMGNHEGMRSMEEENRRIPPRFMKMEVPARARAMKEEALAYIKAHPGDYFGNCVSRAVIALKSETIPVVWNREGILRRFGEGALAPLKILSSLGWWLLLGGLAWKLGRGLFGGGFSREDLVLLLVMAICSAPFVLIDSQNRYHLPLVPFAALLAAEAVTGRRGRSRRPMGPGP